MLPVVWLLLIHQLEETLFRSIFLCPVVIFHQTASCRFELMVDTCLRYNLTCLIWEWGDFGSHNWESLLWKERRRGILSYSSSTYLNSTIIKEIVTCECFLSEFDNVNSLSVYLFLIFCLLYTFMSCFQHISLNFLYMNYSYWMYRIYTIYGWREKDIKSSCQI